MNELPCRLVDELGCRLVDELLCRPVDELACRLVHDDEDEDDCIFEQEDIVGDSFVFISFIIS